MIYKDQLTRKILYLAILFSFTIGIVIVSFIYENRIKHSFEEKIERQKIRDYILLHVQKYVLEYKNNIYNQAYSEQNTDTFFEEQKQIHNHLIFSLSVLQEGGNFKTTFSKKDEIPVSLSPTSSVFYDAAIPGKCKELDENLNIDFINKLQEYFSALPFSSETLEEYLHDNIEQYYSAFSTLEKQTEIARADALKQINNLEYVQKRYLYFYQVFRFVLLFIFLLCNFFFFKKTTEKITEIIKERDIYTMNIKSMNEILREKRNFIDAVLNSVSVGIVVVDTKSHKIININKAALTILQVAFENIIDKRYDNIFKGNDFTKITLKEGFQTVPEEIVLTSSSNKKITVYQHIVVANLNDKLCYIINFVDITKQVQAEKILEESEKFNRAIIDNSPIGISVRDRYGRLLIGNNAWRKIWNITDEKYKKDIAERKEFHFDERDTYLKEHRKQVKKVYSQGGEYYIPALKVVRKKDKSLLWISHHFYALCDENGEVDKVVILSEDITQRKETEDALFERDIRYKALFEQANDAIFLEDTTGNIIDVNQKACRLSGYSKEELIGLSMSKLQVNEPFQYVKSYDGLKIDKNIRFESRLKHKNQEEIPIEKTIAPFADRDDMLFLSIVRDITERKKNEFKQSVLFDISNAVNTTKDMKEMFERLHQLLGKIIDTKNFYIALYDKQTNLIEAAYYHDEKNKTIPPIQEMGSGLTAYVICNQVSLFLTKEKRDQFIQAGKIPQYNWKAKVWLGVPLCNQDKEVIGAMAVQSYTDRNAYDESDLKILEFVSDQVAIAIERKKAEDLLRKSEEKVRAFMHSATDSMTIWDKNGKLLAMNPASLKMLNLDVSIAELLGKSVLEIAPYLEDSEIIQNAYQVYETGVPYFQDYVGELKGIGKRHFSLRVFKFGDNVGAIVSDITDRKIAEEKIRTSLQEKEVMLQEIHHRVKNNMQIVSSLLNLQAKYIVDKKDLELFKESQNRVKSMSLVHEKLYQSRNLANIDFNEYTRNLTKNLYITYGVNSSKIPLLIDIRDIYMDINTAIPCGLIINELVSNSLKYAFPDGRCGKIIISMKQKKEKIVMQVSDDGVGLPEDLDITETDSLGLQLVHTLSLQLESELKVERKNGTSFCLEFA